MNDLLYDFRSYREKMNKKILASGNKVIKRIYNIDIEIFAVANLVGGTIVIPHTRRALEYWEALVEEQAKADNS